VDVLALLFIMVGVVKPYAYVTDMETAGYNKAVTRAC
jgi:hypothetical protein